MEMPALTFASLDERIETPPSTPRPGPAARERRNKLGVALVVVSGVSALLLGKMLPPRPWVWAVLVALLIVELAGLILSVPATLSEILSMRPARQRREMASEMDFDMPGYESTIAWLRSFPRERLQAMSDFAAHRLDRYRSKMPAFIGSLDKLGALPVLAAIVIQFKDASWPPQIGWWQILLFGLLAWFYWMSLLLINLRVRVELYDALLKKALTWPGTCPLPSV